MTTKKKLFRVVGMTSRSDIRCLFIGIRLLKARDSSKDQTYFLSHVHPDALKKTLFPVGDLKKSFVKEIALKYGLEEFARKPEVGWY